MKKLVVGVAALGALVALRPVLKRRIVQKMREHCGQMAEHCKQMMAGQPGPGGEATDREAMHRKMREHCEPTSAQREERSEPVATA